MMVNAHQLWLNDDKMLQRFDDMRSKPAAGGEYVTDGSLRALDFTIDLTELHTEDGEFLLSKTIHIPRGAIPVETELLVLVTPTTSDAANLNLGFADDDLEDTDVDALIDSGDDFIGDAAGSRIVYSVGSTEAGDQYGVTQTEPRFIIAGTDTGTFTAGVVKLKIKYMVGIEPGDVDPDIS